MNKIAVNPTQFITCRLCLEELGLYQIVPSVKDQIAYCFDITVEPFDGLPQLICQKCEKILSTYSSIKKKYIEKQAELKTKICSIQETRIEDRLCAPLTNEEAKENVEFESNNDQTRKHAKRKASISSSTSDKDSSTTNKAKNDRTDRSSFSSEQIDVSTYTKQYVCRICSSRWSKVDLVLNHINKKHSRIYKKFDYVFKRHCQVSMYRTDLDDCAPAFTDKIVHSKEKIVKNVNAKYFIMYTSRNYKENKKRNVSYDDGRKRRRENTVKSKYYFGSDTSDDEVVVKRKRQNRLCSRSSNETVVLENQSDNEKESKENDDACITLDDSSESESGKNAKRQETKSKKQSKATNNDDLQVDQSTINEMITSCGNKYLKKQESMTTKSKKPSDVATNLKRKILSIGRKVINKKISVNCTPLLRFLEHKSLDISWLPREVVYVDQDSNYIRILPRIKHDGEKMESDLGWTDYSSSKSNQGLVNMPAEIVISTPNKDDVQVYTQTQPTVVKPFNGIGIHRFPSEMAVILEANQMSTDTKKLLNENPVANPKQLPKKSTNEIKTTKSTLKPAEIDQPENNEIDYCMPIITSTTSLANPFLIENYPDNGSDISSSKTDDPKSEVPRIKVKPASELMSAETLNRMQTPIQTPFIFSQSLTVNNQNNLINVIIPRVTAGPQPNIFQTNQSAFIAPEPAWQKEFMVLDTVELPNTRTNSPFLYFKNLLQIHNIILLDTHTDLNIDFYCLIKFKVLYKQDNKNQPVILCLSLFCSQNMFCFKVKDRNQDNIELDKISPNWQWEVLKIYKGEVVHKVLNNAQTLGTDVYNYTNKFLCLLKSINQVKVAGAEYSA